MREVNLTKRRNSKDAIAKMVNLINGNGIILNVGCYEEDIDSMKRVVRRIDKSKKIRVLLDWQRWDVDIPRCKMLPSGLLPVMVYSSNVVEDSSSKLESGDYVRSTLAVHIYKECIVETANTFYILVGAGELKKVDLYTALSVK